MEPEKYTAKAVEHFFTADKGGHKRTKEYYIICPADNSGANIPARRAWSISGDRSSADIKIPSSCCQIWSSEAGG